MRDGLETNKQTTKKICFEKGIKKRSSRQIQFFSFFFFLVCVVIEDNDSFPLCNQLDLSVWNHNGFFLLAFLPPFFFLVFSFRGAKGCCVVCFFLTFTLPLPIDL